MLIIRLTSIPHLVQHKSPHYIMTKYAGLLALILSERSMMLKLEDNMGEEDDCNTSLSLAIIGPQKVPAVSGHVANNQRKQELELSLWHSPDLNKAGEDHQDQDSDKWGCRLVDEEEGGNNKCFNNHERGVVARKKLQLTREQSRSLEKSFGEHGTLSQIQKQELASRLSLLPRQVEVWFQNRRARTKIKQTEVDCKFLKSCCQNLIHENRRLKKELQELRALNVLAPMSPRFALHFCPATAEKIAVPSPTAINESMSEDDKPKLVLGPGPLSDK